MICFFRQSEDLVCFKDIKLVVFYYYFVVLKKYIGNCRELKKDYVELGKIMAVFFMNILF